MQSFLLSRIVSIAMWWPWWLVAEWLWDSTGAAEWEWDWERDCWMRLRVGLLSETESGTAEWEWDCWMRVRLRVGVLSENGTAEWEWDCWVRVGLLSETESGTAEWERDCCVRLRVGLLSESGTAVRDWEWDCWVRAGLNRVVHLHSSILRWTFLICQSTPHSVLRKQKLSFWPQDGQIRTLGSSGEPCFNCNRL